MHGLSPKVCLWSGKDKNRIKKSLKDNEEEIAVCQNKMYCSHWTLS